MTVYHNCNWSASQHRGLYDALQSIRAVVLALKPKNDRYDRLVLQAERASIKRAFHRFERISTAKEEITLEKQRSTFSRDERTAVTLSPAACVSQQPTSDAKGGLRSLTDAAKEPNRT